MLGSARTMIRENNYEGAAARLDAFAKELKAAKKRRRTMADRHTMAALDAEIAYGSIDRKRYSDSQLELLKAEIEAGVENARRDLDTAEEDLERAEGAHNEAYREYLLATVEPRVEAAKLRFEEDKLRATLSSASIVGIAATSGVLLPGDPGYIWLLAAAFLCLFASAVLSLGAMSRTSEYVESTLIRRDVDEPRGVIRWATRHSFTLGLVVFALHVVLNVAG